MAADSKTIDQLPSKETLSNNDMFPVDDGEQTYKILFSKFLEAIPGVVSVTQSQDGQSIVVQPRTGNPVTITIHDNTKQNVLTFDNTPTQNSSNPVKSSGIYTADQALASAINEEAQTARETEAALAGRLNTAEGNIQSLGTAVGTKMTTSVYDSNGSGVVDNAEKVNGKTVAENVPSGAKFTDTVYDDTEVRGLIAGVNGKVGDITQLDTEARSDLVAAVNELVSDFAGVDEEVEKLDAFSGSQTLLDSEGNEILDSSNNRILDTEYGAAGVATTLSNIVSWFKNNLSHLIQDSGYTQTKELYEILNS
jgi:hypothetical protein